MQLVLVFVDYVFGVVVGWVEYLEEVLGVVFLVDQGVVVFGEVGCWQYQVCFGGGGGLLVIGDDYYFGCCQGCVDMGGVGVVIEIVFQYYYGVGLFGGQLFECGFYGVVVEECQVEVVGFVDYQVDGIVFFVLFEGFGDVCCGFD